MYCRNHVDVSEGVRPCARCQTAFCGDCLVTINGRDYCAVCKTEQVMDVRSGTVAGVLPLASIGRPTHRHIRLTRGSAGCTDGDEGEVGPRNRVRILRRER